MPQRAESPDDFDREEDVVLCLAGALVAATVTAASGGHAASGTGGMRATVPEVATRGTDGLPSRLVAGSYDVRLPVWAAAGTRFGRAVVEVRGANQTCSPVDTVPGAVVWLSCRLDVKRSSTPLELRLIVGSAVIGQWRHDRR
jgi:hypothetical protein